jgi:NAD-dependent dihydropyrimidine dehydrogenase PreA subunit
MAAKIDADACIGCGCCEGACPMEIIELQDDVAVLVDPDSCTECGSCVDACAVEAISL